jgi:hypothetical protein
VSPIARGTDRSPRLHHGTPCFPHPPLPSTDAVRAMRGAAPLCGATSPGYDACDEGHGGARFPRARRAACRANPKTRTTPRAIAVTSSIATPAAVVSPRVSETARAS